MTTDTQQSDTTSNAALVQRFKQNQRELQRQERRNRGRYVPRNIERHTDERAAERARLEHDLEIPFHRSDELAALNGVDRIRTNNGDGLS